MRGIRQLSFQTRGNLRQHWEVSEQDLPDSTHSKEITLFPALRQPSPPTDDETQILDALERDLAGSVVFPLSDGAEVDVAPVVGRPRQSRRLVLI